MIDICRRKDLYVLAPIDGLGPVKVGCSRQLEKRVRVLRRALGGRELAVVYCRRYEDGDVAFKIEANVKRSLREFRVAGEWFNISPAGMVSAVERSTFLVTAEPHEILASFGRACPPGPDVAIEAAQAPGP